MKKPSTLIICTICIIVLTAGGKKEAEIIESEPVESSDSNLIKTSNSVYYTNGDSNVSGYLAIPQVTNSTAPGIILIHEWWGLNDDIKAQAEKFAKLGYVALAVDLYNGAVTTDPAEARVLATTIRENQFEAFENLASALDYIKTIEQVDQEKLATIGWCFGGGWSYQIAKNNLGVKASVIYYGQFNPTDDLSVMRTDIVGHFADQDRTISIDSVNEFQANLKTTHGSHEIYIYPNTQHGFASRKGNNPDYENTAAEMAWQRTIQFLEKTLF